MYAVPRPSLPGRCMTWTWSSLAARSSAISPVPSGELSSTTIRSASGAAARTSADEARQIVLLVVRRRDDEGRACQVASARYQLDNRDKLGTWSSKPASPRSANGAIRESDRACARAHRRARRGARARARASASALREVGLALGTTLDLDQLLELILEKITEARRGRPRHALPPRRARSDELVSRIVQGDEVRSIRLKVGEGIAGHVAQTGKRAPRAATRTRTRASTPSGTCSRATARGSILAAPMKNHLGRTIGVIQVLNKKRGEFTRRRRRHPRRARDAGRDLDRQLAPLSLGHAEEHPARSRSRSSSSIASAISSSSSISRARWAARTSLDELFIARPQRGDARVRGARRAPSRSATARATASRVASTSSTTSTRSCARFPLREGQGLIGGAMRNGEVVFTDRRAERSSAPTPRSTSSSASTRTTALAVPLEGEDGATMGAIALYNKRDATGLHRRGPRAPRAHRRQRVDRDPPPDGARGARARRAPHDHRPPALGRHPRPEDAAHRHQRLRAADADGRAKREARRVRRARAQAVRSHRRDAARGARVRARREERPRPQGLPRRSSSTTCASSSSRSSRATDVELVIDVQDKGTARFDEGKILRVVHNLARNAAEAMADKGGKLHDQGDARDKDDDDETLVITFSDTGPGIPKEIEHRLFQSFVTSGQEGRHGPRPRHREEDRRRARRHDHRALDEPRRDLRRCASRKPKTRGDVARAP